MSSKYPSIGDDRSPIERLYGTSKNLATTGIALAPLAIGVSAGYRNTIGSNTAAAVLSLSTGQGGDVNRKVGESLVSANEVKRRARAIARESFVTQLVDEKKIEEILGRKKEREVRALLNTITTVLDDPSIVGDNVLSTDRTRMKDVIHGILQNSIEEVTDEQRQSVQEIVESVLESHDKSASQIYNAKQGLFGEMSPRLVPSLSTDGINAAYNPITSKGSMSNVAQARLNKLQQMVGNSTTQIEAIAIHETKFGSGAGIGHYARISRPNRDPMLVALDLTSVRESTGATIVRSRAGTVTHAAPALFLDAGQLNLLASNKIDHTLISSSLEGTSSTRFARNYESFAFSSLISRLEAVGGDFSKLDANKYYGSLEQYTNQVFTPSSSEASSRLTERARKHSSQAKITGMQHLSPTDRASLVTKLASNSSNVFDAFANIAETERTASGGMFSSIGLNALPTGQSYQGINPKGVTSLHQLPMVNRVIDPLNARIQQQHNRPGVFVGGGKALFIMDFADDALERLGFGEGQGYVGNQQAVREDFVKGVMSGHSLKRDDPVLLKELIHRKKTATMASNTSLLKVAPGQTITLQTVEAREAFTRALIEGHDKVDKNVINALRNQGTFVFSGRAEAFKNQVDTFFQAFGGTKAGRGLELGLLDDKIVTMPKFTGLQGFEIGVSHVSDVGGRKKVHLAGSTDILSHFQKIFSDFGKITGRPMNQDSYGRTLERMGTNAQVLSNVGIDFANQTTVITDSSMIKKSSYNASMQLTSSFLEFDRIKRGYNASQAGVLYATLNEFLTKDKFQEIDLSTTSAKEMQGRYMRSVIRTVAQGISQSEKSFSSQELGFIFGGIGKQQSSYGFAGKEGQGIDFLKQTFKDIGRELTSSDIAEIKKGRGIAIQEMTAPGHGPSMYRRNTGSMSPRTFNYLGHKLSSAGFSNDKVAGFLFSILSRSTEIPEHIASVNQYRTMLESMSGGVGPMKSLQMSELERVSVQDFIRKAGASPEEAEKFLLQKMEGGKAVDRTAKGFILDFDPIGTTDEEINQMRRIKAAVKSGTKASSGMYMAAGLDFMEDIARTGTDIEKTEGRQRILPEYVRKVHQFAKDLSVVQSTLSTSGEEIAKAAKNVRGFRESIGDLFAASMKGILKGDLTGTAYVQTSFIQFNPDGTVTMPGQKDSLGNIVKASTDLNEQQHSMMSRVMKNTPKERMASMAFMDSEAFFSSFSTFEDAAVSEYKEREMAKLVGKDLTPEQLLVEKERIGKGAAQSAKVEASQKVKQFFLGTHQAEQGVGQGFRGLETIIKRDPDLGAGHLQWGSVYRNVGEEMLEIDKSGKVTKDVYFDKYLQTGEGQKQLRNLKYQIGDQAVESFQDISKLKILEAGKMLEFDQEVWNKEKETFENKRVRITKESQSKAIDKFFMGMVHEKHMISIGEGGGRVLFPNLHIDVHYESGSARRFDASLAQGMIADADGDINQILHPTKAGMTALREGKDGIANFNRLLVDDLVLRHHTGMFMQMASEGMKNLEKTLADELTGEEFIKQTILKEHQGKAIGPLDVSIGALRQSIVATAGSREEAILANQVISMFVGFQETGSIKSKKLPRAQELAKHMNRILRDLIQSGGESIDDFQKLLESTVLRGVNVNNAITSVDTSGLPTKAMGQLFEEGLKDERFTLKSLLSVIQRSAAHSGANNLLEHETTQRLAKAAVEMSSAEQNAQFNRGMYASTAGAISGAGEIYPSGVDKHVRQAQSIISDTKRIVARGERSMMGPLAIGAVGAMAASALMGYKGYDPEPMLMPGEITDPGIGSAIRNGSIYDSMSSGPSPEMLMARNNNDMMNRPIMDSVARVELNNSFSVKGEAVSYGHAKNMSQQISSMGGRSSVTINDTRLPITRNYINRVMNE